MGVNDKWRFAVGTTSRVPGTNGKWHYLILDYDNSSIENVRKKLPDAMWFSQDTPNGVHCYSMIVGTFGYIIMLAEKLGADPAWLRIGQKRGYLFLADKAPLHLPWPVERMVIWRKENAKDQR